MNGAKKPSNLITVAEGKQMEDYYKQEFYNYLNGIKDDEYPGYDGAVRDIWFDLNNLKEYIAYIENYAKAQGHTGLGMRIYLGAKDKVGQDGFNYPRQTVFFVPTCRQASQSGFTNNNITGIERLNFGTGGEPDSMDSDMGTP